MVCFSLCMCHATLIRKELFSAAEKELQVHHHPSHLDNNEQLWGDVGFITGGATSNASALRSSMVADLRQERGWLMVTMMWIEWGERQDHFGYVDH